MARELHGSTPTAIPRPTRPSGETSTSSSEAIPSARTPQEPPPGLYQEFGHEEEPGTGIPLRSAQNMAGPADLYPPRAPTDSYPRDPRHEDVSNDPALRYEPASLGDHYQQGPSGDSAGTLLPTMPMPPQQAWPGHAPRTSERRTRPEPKAGRTKRGTWGHEICGRAVGARKCWVPQKPR